MPGLGGIGMMATLSGEARAMELILSGRTFGALEAFEWKLVDHLVPKKQMTGFITEFINSMDKKYVKEKKVLYLNRYLNKLWH
jgi:enoyl-CoA hydratase/carnithine racemase